MKPLLGVLGGGYVGLAVAVGFAERGFSVVLAETSPARFQALAEGSFFSSEKDLVKAFHQLKEAGLMTITQDYSLLRDTPLVFACVGTPAGVDGETDLTQLWQAVENVMPFLQENAGFIIKSTVPIGTGDLVQQWFERVGKRVEVISYPEFLREGKTLEDFRSPSRVILGGNPNHPRVKELRKMVSDQALPILLTTRKNAEMIKYAANAFLATKISFINQMAQLSDAFGTDVQTVAWGMGLDPRIGQAFLGAGLGFGGPCLPKDLLSLMKQASQQGKETPLLQAVMAINEGQRYWPIEKLKGQLKELPGKTIAIWGVTFKGGSEDIRDSIAIPVMEELLKEHCILHIHDPYGLPSLKKKWAEEGVQSSYERQMVWCQDRMAAVEQADALLILTDWLEFKEADLLQVKEHLKTPLVIDGRNLYPPEMMRSLGFNYVSVGRKV